MDTIKNLATKAIDDTREILNDIDKIKKDPDTFIYEYFQEIKRQVDLRRENLKTEIDNYSEEIILKITNTEAKCYKLEHDINEISESIQSSRIELDKLIGSFDVNTQDGELSELKHIKPRVKLLLEELKSAFIGNKVYMFKFENRTIEDFFGEISSIPWNFIDSKILNKQMLKDLLNLCEFPKYQVLDLVYRATANGFGSLDFHTKCDGLPNTLTIIKSTNDNIFGGYTERAWSSNDEYLRDENAFIFSLRNKDMNPFRTWSSEESAEAICCHPSYGPTFGYSGDLFISTNSNINSNSYTDFGCSFKHGSYLTGSVEAATILAGSFNFQITEIEVFTVANRLE